MGFSKVGYNLSEHDSECLGARGNDTFITQRFNFYEKKSTLYVTQNTEDRQHTDQSK